MTEKQTVAGAYAKIEAHEDLCAERYKNIHDSMGDLKGLIHWIIKGLAGLVFALLAWMAVQIYTTNNARLTALEKEPPASLAGAR
jgi:hypothetical protein